MVLQLCKAYRRCDQELSSNCVRIHCILHREALVTKKLKLNVDKAGGQQIEVDNVLWEVVHIVNSIRKSAKQQRPFSKLCREMSSTSKKLILHSEGRWLSRGKVLSGLFELREELEVFYTEESNPKADKFRDIFSVAKLAYLASIFDRLNQLNISLQGKGGDKFRSASKINALKMKIPLRKNNVLSKNFSDFPLLSQYTKESEWEFHDVTVQDNLSTFIVGHLDLLHDNLTAYFPEENDHRLKANM